MESQLTKLTMVSRYLNIIEIAWHGESTIADIAETLGKHISQVSREISQLEIVGLIEKKRTPMGKVLKPTRECRAIVKQYNKQAI